MIVVQLTHFMRLVLSCFSSTFFYRRGKNTQNRRNLPETAQKSVGIGKEGFSLVLTVGKLNTCCLFCFREVPGPEWWVPGWEYLQKSCLSYCLFSSKNFALDTRPSSIANDWTNVQLAITKFRTKSWENADEEDCKEQCSVLDRKQKHSKLARSLPRSPQQISRLSLRHS